jgi:transcriptional regulator
MYDLPYFKEPDCGAVLEFMRRHPFVLLTGCGEAQRVVATQVPVFIDEQPGGSLVLTGHIQRKTDHHKAFLQNNEVLTLFTGPHTYISASWYEEKQAASTWNYMTVHARGSLRFLDDAALLRVLQRTTNFFENNPGSPSLVEKMPPEYVERMMKAIVAFEITITSMEHVFKLSQNRDAKSYNSIIEKLNGQGGDAAAIAAEMEKRKAGLFKNASL